ncbi:unnamed protein product [Urochloa humidicola]
MEETYPWRKQFEQRMIDTRHWASSGRFLVFSAWAYIALPLAIRPADAEGGADLVARLEHDLKDACSELNLAAVWMGAVELVALRSGGHSPVAPLRSIDDLARDADDLALRLALAKLQDARPRAEDAIGGVAAARGHLGAAGVLLDHPGVHGVDGCVEAERAAAADALEAALLKAEEVEALVGAALEVVGVSI